MSNLLNTDISQKAAVGSGLDIRFVNDALSYGIRASTAACDASRPTGSGVTLFFPATHASALESARSVRYRSA